MYLLFAAIFFLVTPAGFYERQGYVNDYANSLTAKKKLFFEKELQSLDAKEGIQFVVVVVPDLHGQPIQGLSQQFFARWQIGHLHRDSGILLIVSPKESFIDLGYGLEGFISTKQAQDICTSVINPMLQQDKLAEAVEKGISAVFSTIGVAFANEEISETRSIYTTRSALLFFLSLPLLYLVARLAPTRLFFLSPVAGFCAGITQSLGLAIVLGAFGCVMVLICYILKYKIPPHLKG